MATGMRYVATDLMNAFFFILVKNGKKEVHGAAVPGPRVCMSVHLPSPALPPGQLGSKLQQDARSGTV